MSVNENDFLLNATPVIASVGDAVAAFELDMTDDWEGETDPECERGEGCVGLFSETGRLLGIEITSGGYGSKIVTEYKPRAFALSALGMDAVRRCERWMDMLIFSGEATPVQY